MTPGRHERLVASLVGLTVILSACSTPATGASTLPPITYISPEDLAPPVPDLNEQQVALGAQLYTQQCASCHQSDLSGEADWKIPKADGTYPAPPHDSTGHTWHHPDQLLLQIIRDGIDVPGTTMPTFGDRLSDDEIQSIIEYLKSSWGPEERAAQWQVTWQLTR